jgi:hypothetical protein
MEKGSNWQAKNRKIIIWAKASQLKQVIGGNQKNLQSELVSYSILTHLNNQYYIQLLSRFNLEYPQRNWQFILELS